MCRDACVFWFRVFYYDIGFDIVLAHRCWWKYIFYVHKNGRRDTKCPPLRFGGHTPPVTATGFLRTFSRIILYKIENTAVAATRFFAGEVEIFDFVTERVKRCIAAIVVRYRFYILCVQRCCWSGELVKGFWRRYLYTLFIYSIFLYIHS